MKTNLYVLAVGALIFGTHAHASLKSPNQLRCVVEHASSSLNTILSPQGYLSEGDEIDLDTSINEIKQNLTFSKGGHIPLASIGASLVKTSSPSERLTVFRGAKKLPQFSYEMALQLASDGASVDGQLQILRRRNSTGVLSLGTAVLLCIAK